MKETLSVQEQIIVEGIALARHSINLEKKRNNMKVGNGNDLKINVEGIAGEFAFCKIHNIYPDMSVDYPLPFDCKIGDYTIDVKTTPHKNGHLAVPIYKSTYKVPTYFALMIGSMPTYEFKGFFRGDQMFYDYNIKTLLTEPTYAISQDRLKMEL